MVHIRKILVSHLTIVNFLEGQFKKLQKFNENDFTFDNISGFEDFDYLPEIPIVEEVKETNVTDDLDYEDLYGENGDDEIQFEVKIVGGSVTKPHSYPFAAVLTSPKYNNHFCGGTLITRRHVVTAAHCFHGDPK